MRAVYPGAGSAVMLQAGDYTAKESGFYVAGLNDWIFEGQSLGGLLRTALA